MNEVSATIPSYGAQKAAMMQQIATKVPQELRTKLTEVADQAGVDFPNPLKLKTGDKAPLFELPDANGHEVKLGDLLQKGQVVLVFYRGAWCPYCNLALKTYQSVLPQIKEKGASLVAISGQNPDASLSTKEKNELEFEVLSDAQFKVSALYTSIFTDSDVHIGLMKQMGHDFHSFYSGDSADLLVPAVYVINQEGIVTFVGAQSGDFRERAEPVDILAALG